MNEYKTIEKELLMIDQSKMQDIVFQIIDKRYKPTNIVNLGSASGVQTTRYGTPDIFLQLSNENYIFVEVTIQKNRLLSKIKSDIEKCKENAKKLLDENANIEKVIFACVGKMKTYELQECQNLCKEFCINVNSPFEFWGLDKLSALLLHTYQSVAVSELNIKFTYEIIETLDEYLQNNKYDISQQHEFLFRENELCEIQNKLLEKNIVLLHGPAGCGKTRLCIHLAQKLKISNQINEIYYIKNAFSNPFEAICNVVEQNNVAIILDDVNRLPFKDFIIYAQKHKNVYILATVRDYAKNTIAVDLKNNNLDKLLEFIQISPLSKEEQEKVLKTIIPGASYDILVSIQNVAHENLRFAIMMAEVLNKHGYLPTEMKELMKYHFNSVNTDLKKAITKGNNINYLKSLVLLAFFHRIVMEDGDYNWEYIKAALNQIGISCDIFHDAIDYWDRQEVVNISYEGKVCEIGDQILSTYLFYKLVIEDKQISLATIFKLFFPKYRKCFVDMFNSVLPAYGYQDELIIHPLEKLWNEHYKIINNTETIQFVSVFFELLPLESLEYIKKQGIPIRQDFINILCNYEPSIYYIAAIDLIFNHIDNYSIEENIITNLIESFSVSRHSFDNQFVSQKYFLKKLLERIKNNDVCRKIFLGLTKKILDLSFHTTELNKNSLVCFTIEAKPYKYLLETRTLIWNGLITLYENYFYKDLRQLLEYFRFFSNCEKSDESKIFFSNDKQTILPFVNSQLNNQLTFEQMIILNNMLECCCSDRSDEYKNILNQLKEKSIEFKIYNEAFSRKKENFDWRSRTSKYDNVFNLINIPEDFHSYIIALQSLECGRDVISYAVDAYFRYVNKNLPSHFEEYLKKFITEFSYLDINCGEIANIISYHDKTIEFIDFVLTSSMINKNIMILELLKNLKCKDISLQLYNLCLKTFKDEYCVKNETNSVLYVSEFIEFEKFQSGFILTIFKFILESNNKNLNKYRIIDDFFIEMKTNEWSYKNLQIEKIESFFGEELKSVFYEMFFVLIKKNILHSSDKFIHYLAKKDIEYLYRYYDLFFIHEEYFSSSYLDIDALKQLPNIANNLLVIYDRSKKISKYGLSIYAIKNIMLNNLNNESFLEFAQLFIDKYISEKKDLEDMSTYVSSLKSEWQLIYVQTLISKNVDIEIFKVLDIFAHPSIWSGSEVPIYEKMIETIDTFLASTTITAENLSYITNIKERKNKYIEYKKKARLRELSDYRFFA